MTCIAAIKNKAGRIIMAGDRRVHFGEDHYDEVANSKIIKREGMLFGGSGDAYLSDLICFITPVPAWGECPTAFDYIHTKFTKSVIKTLEERGFRLHSFSEEIVCDCLIAINGELFQFSIRESGLEIIQVRAPFAVGCGGRDAIVHLKSTEKTGLKAKQRLRDALIIVSKVSSGCDANIDIIEED